MAMTPPYQQSRPAKSLPAAMSWILKALLVGCAALVFFASSIHAKSFEDEYAYITQSYYADRFFKGKVNDRDWLDFFAYDLQPLPKYLIGLCLNFYDLRRPGPADARNWYLSYAHFGTGLTLAAARLPIVVLGSLGCVGLFACGTQVRDSRTGAIAAVLMMVNPLYSLHAHRAMSDVPCEALGVAALALYLWAWRRSWTNCRGLLCLLFYGLAGVAAGLALLCKFNGFLTLVIVAAWAGVAAFAPGLARKKKLVAAVGVLVTIVTALLLQVALNPYLTARPRGVLPDRARPLLTMNPWQRFLFQVRHRIELSDDQKKTFPNDALHTVTEKAEVAVVQGLGRFGAFGPCLSDSRVRFDRRQDRGLMFWTPLVLLGLVESIGLFMRQCRAGAPPTGLALLIWAGLAWSVVVVYLPMAWDRYLLPVQPVNALLAALAATMVWERVVEIVSSPRARA
jgi:4-amino-4-deoxy-L-arabinose transferase-like glycosyltransferase